MTANDSSSSAASQCFEVDLLGDDCPGKGRLAPLPAAYLRGKDHDLLEPLRHLTPGSLPQGPAPQVDRTRIAAALRTANGAYGHPRAEELARKLADPATRVVVTGQQPGLWGGPLMTLTKAAAAVRWAAAIEASGTSAVAIFWVATEDHDFAESSHAVLLGHDGAESVDLGDDPAPLLPVGMRTLGSPLEAASARAEELLAGGDAAARFAAARAFYRPDARFGEAFSRLMIRLLGDRAPLFLDAMLPEMKSLQAPYMRKLVVERATVDAAYVARDAAIQDRGYSLQVAPQPGLSPLFLLHASGDAIERRRIDWLGAGRYGLRGIEGFDRLIDDLLATLDENPSAVTPGVLARPALQDAVLGTTLQVLGPGELSYMAQAAAVYPLLGIAPPHVTLRPQSLLLDQRSAGWLEELDVPLRDLLDQTAEEIVAARLGSDPVTPAKERIDAVLAELRDAVLQVDATLEKPWSKTRDNVHRGLDTFAGKVQNAVANRHQVWLRRMEKLRQTLLPDGGLQERKIATLFFYARYGDELVRALLDGLELDPRRLSVIRLAT